jgi:tRNA C32,U32 (ribose-2'-O)-methylase TrmJ
LKEAYRTLVKNLPAEQQEKAMMSIASRTLRIIAPRQQLSKGARSLARAAKRDVLEATISQF